MAHGSKETITIAWCDGGMVDGKFMDGVLTTSLYAISNGINVVNKIRVPAAAVVPPWLINAPFSCNVFGIGADVIETLSFTIGNCIIK